MVKAVDGVSFTLNSGEILGVIGESGCGKSTLGRLLVNLEPLSRGDILINGKSIRSVNLSNKSERLAFRRTVQLIFQNPSKAWTPGNRGKGADDRCACIPSGTATTNGAKSASTRWKRPACARRRIF